MEATGGSHAEPEDDAIGIGFGTVVKTEHADTANRKRAAEVQIGGRIFDLSKFEESEI